MRPTVTIANIPTADLYSPRAVADVIEMRPRGRPRTKHSKYHGPLGDCEERRDAGAAIIATNRLLERLQCYHPDRDPRNGGPG